MSTEETPSWAKKYLDNFEARMDGLENPGKQKPPGPDPENDFIDLMREINTNGQADQAEDSGTVEGNGTDEDEFIADMAKINRLTDEGQGEQ